MSPGNGSHTKGPKQGKKGREVLHRPTLHHHWPSCLPLQCIPVPPPPAQPPCPTIECSNNEDPSDHCFCSPMGFQSAGSTQPQPCGAERRRDRGSVPRGQTCCEQTTFVSLLIRLFCFGCRPPNISNNLSSLQSALVHFGW